MTSPPTRGFVGRHTAAERDPRLPPGQYDARADFPVLSAEVTPELAPADWTLRVDGLVARPRTWTWEQAHELPASGYDGPIHCVTSWSKLTTDFAGISLDTFLAAAGPLPTATHAVAYSHTGYTTNLALADLVDGQAWIAFDFAGDPLTPAHGGPARLLVPHLYFWKSVKWIAGLRLLDHDEPGFWETNGYHHRGDPWAEERYSGD
ncbi:sulfite oxidase-like oxidoreductase [Streptomyces sp. SID3343]|uniref:sulfite oxidase-like oxidoreductase n=1 Tax=Streptomyces sp. SID3343 TaxID=2690260 RepID=UPI0013695A46|nr:sulfite oxidase-like oxidoreductase [Streptomyces sp. SID3343]MYV97541.1 molybdopterin-dependent oxidoreductase [Streptomyces sp. SID3343]